VRGMKGSILAAAISAAALAGLAGTPVWAQTAAAVQLSQTYDYNGQWAIDYPAGWVLDLTGFPVFASIPTAVGVLIQNDPLPVGTMVIGIIPPETNSLLGVTAGMPLEDVARRVATFYGASDVVATPFETTAGPAVSAPLPSIRMPAGSGLLVVDHDGTTFVFLVVVGDLAGATPLLQAMLATLR
jgi:hypothetical protein